MIFCFTTFSIKVGYLFFRFNKYLHIRDVTLFLSDFVVLFCFPQRKIVFLFDGKAENGDV